MVCYGIDQVELAHKVNGRFSFMVLCDNDQIMHKGNQITVREILNTIVESKSEKHSQIDIGRSFYQGELVTVVLNPESTRSLEAANTRRFINQLFKNAKSGLISYEDLQEAMLKLEVDDELE